jgi:hypothetical protein
MAERVEGCLRLLLPRLISIRRRFSLSKHNVEARAYRASRNRRLALHHTHLYYQYIRREQYYGDTESKKYTNK